MNHITFEDRQTFRIQIDRCHCISIGTWPVGLDVFRLWAMEPPTLTFERHIKNSFQSFPGKTHHRDLLRNKSSFLVNLIIQSHHISEVCYIPGELPCPERSGAFLGWCGSRRFWFHQIYQLSLCILCCSWTRSGQVDIKMFI